MSVIVKGMEMPESCYECVCEHSFFKMLKCADLPGMRGYDSEHIPHMHDRHPDCPLQELSEPHGRLIDENGVLAALRSKAFDLASGDAGEYRALMWAFKQIESAPTIIEAEEGD